jgi:TolB-like protein/Tfp pilus assembly protein PilF
VPAVALLISAGLAIAYWALRPVSAAPRSVAVLPFVTAAVGGSSGDAYLAFGISDVLTSELSRIPALRVISQTSALRYRNANMRLPDIARELGVGAIVEGSLVREGDRIRVTVQLIDAAQDEHLWAETVRVNPAEVSRAQGAVARRIAAAIGAVLTGQAPQAVGPARESNSAADDLLWQGRYLMSLGTEAGREQALALFNDALGKDADHAPLHAALADYYVLTDSMPTTSAIPRARHHVERALALDPALAEAHVTLGFIRYYGEWNWSEAEEQFRRALALNPTLTRARRWHAMFLAAMGRCDQARREIEQALDVDPVSLHSLDSAAQVYFHCRSADRLAATAQRLRAISPGSPLGYEALAGTSVLRADYPAALDAALQGLRLSDGDALFVAIAAFTEGALGRRDAARARARELAEKSETSFIPPFLIAIAHVGAGDRELALDALEHGSRERDAYLVFLKASPWMDSLRDDPRYQAVLRRMNFPPN